MNKFYLSLLFQVFLLIDLACIVAWLDGTRADMAYVMIMFVVTQRIVGYLWELR
jgi:hypothetical protein